MARRKPDPNRHDGPGLYEISVHFAPAHTMDLEMGRGPSDFIAMYTVTYTVSAFLNSQESAQKILHLLTKFGALKSPDLVFAVGTAHKCKPPRRYE